MATATPVELEDVELPIVELEKHYEVIDGLIVEEPPLGAREVRMASRLVRSIILFDPTGDLGEVVEGALFTLLESPLLRRRPDVAFVSRERWPADRPIDRGAAWDVVPDLVIEVISPSDPAYDTMGKIEEYFRAGVRLVWVVYPDLAKVYAYDSSTSVSILKVGDEFDGGPVLPGFRYPVSGLF